MLVAVVIGKIRLIILITTISNNIGNFEFNLVPPPYCLNTKTMPRLTIFSIYHAPELHGAPGAS